MPKSIPEKRLFTIREAGILLGRSPYSVRTPIWKGLLPVVQPDGSRKQWLDRQDLNAFVEKNKVLKQ